MSILNNLKRKNDEVEQPKDTLGGFSVLESDVYDAAVKMAYLDTSSGGAAFIDFEFLLPEEKVYKERVYVSSGDKKGNSNTYTAKNGKQYYLPGFIVADDIAAVTTGHLLADQESEEKTIKVYDYELKSDVDKEVPVLVDLLGKKLKLGIRKVREFKRKEVSKGVWKTVDEIREFNEIDKVFNEDGFTVNELLDEAAEAEFMDQWANKNKDNVKDLTKGKKPDIDDSNSGTGSPLTAKKKSLFNK